MAISNLTGFGKMKGDANSKTYIINIIDTVTIQSNVYTINAYILASSQLTTIQEIYNYINNNGFGYVIVGGQSGEHHIPACGNIFPTSGAYLPIVAIKTVGNAVSYVYTAGSNASYVGSTSNVQIYSMEV